MEKQKSLFYTVNEIFSDTHQIQRIIIFLGMALVLAVISFGGYYYYDRYYTSQPKIAEMNIAQAEQAVRDDPQSVEARLALAETYLFNMQHAEALIQANQVYATNPDEERAWLIMGVASANIGKPADAIEPLSKFVEARKDQEMPGLDKQLQAAAYFLGDSYLQLGQPENAVAPLEAAVGWSQMDADSLYKLGLAYSGIQQFDHALYVFLRAVTFVPDFREVYEGMLNIFETTGEPDLANYARGMVAYSQKEYNTALELLLNSAQARPDFAPVFVGLGLTYEAIGDLQNAKSSFESVLLLDPNNFTAQSGIQRLEAAMKK